ncbi:hypothetical protein O181_034031 [Austropuccinia psidii MF-1]|uniref:Uncharacterized protein n=1 Tax=Austropuccinia psidii MF-1 TaxID=1389203 RepID=A0A9Q3D5K6_9BASI|nr:hypothetical protein [Austropuccinia psidii MF-1]
MPTLQQKKNPFSLLDQMPSFQLPTKTIHQGLRKTLDMAKPKKLKIDTRLPHRLPLTSPIHHHNKKIPTHTHLPPNTHPNSLKPNPLAQHSHPPQTLPFFASLPHYLIIPLHL